MTTMRMTDRDDVVNGKAVARLEIMYCQVGLMMATESGSPTVRESSTRRM